MYKKAWCTCKVVVLLSKLIAFSRFLLPSPSSSLSLKFPIVVIQKFCYHGNTVTSHFSSLLLCFQNLACKTFPIFPSWLCLQSNWCLNLLKFIPTITISVCTLLNYTLSLRFDKTNRLYNVSQQMAVIKGSQLTEGDISVYSLSEGKIYLYNITI